MSVLLFFIFYCIFLELSKLEFLSINSQRNTHCDSFTHHINRHTHVEYILSCTHVLCSVVATNSFLMQLLLYFFFSKGRYLWAHFNWCCVICYIICLRCLLLLLLFTHTITKSTKNVITFCACWRTYVCLYV